MKEAYAKAMTYGGAGGALIFGWDANTVVGVGGLCIGIGGLLMTWYFQRKRDKREQAEHEMRMRRES